MTDDSVLRRDDSEVDPERAREDGDTTGIADGGALTGALMGGAVGGPAGALAANAVGMGVEARDMPDAPADADTDTPDR